jgi:EamA domain-containing membrane protein RarD
MLARLSALAVAAATTAVLVLFASAAAVLKFSLIGTIEYTSYTLLLFLMGLVLTFIAQKLVIGECFHCCYYLCLFSL